MSTWLIVLFSAAFRGWRFAAPVQFTRDRVRDVAQLLFLLLKVLRRGRGAILLEPFGGFLDGVKKLR